MINKGMKLDQIRSYLTEDNRYSRDEMPQISKKHLKKAGIPFRKKTVMINQLIPVQKERVDGLVDKTANQMISSRKRKPLIVSKDFEIVNGHHRYDAAKKLGLIELDIFLVDRTLDQLVQEFSYLAKEDHNKRILTPEEFAFHNQHDQQQVIVEGVLDLDEQVDYIWDNYFEEVHEKIVGGEPDISYTIYRARKEFPSTDLPSSVEVDKANEVNPVVIIVNQLDEESYYDWKEKVIHLNFNIHAIDYIESNFRNYKDATSPENRNPRTNRIKGDLSRHRVKGTIHHELSHWVRDSLHNRYLKALTTKAHRQRLSGKHEKALRTLKTGKDDVAMSSYEIDAQIHSIIQAKREHRGIWDNLTFDEMTDLNQSLYFIARKARREGWYDQWKRLLLTRMSRENLLGRKMR